MDISKMKASPVICLIKVDEYEVFHLSDGNIRAQQKGGNAVDFPHDSKMFYELRAAAATSLDAIKECIKSIVDSYSIEEK